MSVLSMRVWLLFLVALAARCGTIGSIRVEGNSRYPAAAVIAASGLKPGISASPDDLQAATQRLMDTGLFSSTNYRYVPARSEDKPVIDVTLVVFEISDLRPCRIQIPGTDEETVWTWLGENEPLVQKSIPTNDAAESLYVRAIERFMAERLGRKEKVIAKLAGPAMFYLFRPEILPKVTALRFEGNQAIPAADLVKALGPVAIASEYTELEFVSWVEHNLRPLYENIGRLRVRFPRVSIQAEASGGVAVTTAIEEGAVYKLEAVDIAAEALPPAVLKLMEPKPGDVVNILAVTLCTQKMESALPHYGYLHPNARIDRTLDDQKNLARITVTLDQGRQSKMGDLRIVGLDAPSEARNRARWPIAPGAPLDMDAVHSFRFELVHGAGARRVELRLEPRTGSDVVDLVYTFQ
ncbi:MAG TPA: POTRA domain-containing protein [Bryobacteraceae bacterium]|nr:POTRA domain-containing protein [Bryobacteraceae bacterium]